MKLGQQYTNGIPATCWYDESFWDLRDEDGRLISHIWEWTEESIRYFGDVICVCVM